MRPLISPVMVNSHFVSLERSVSSSPLDAFEHPVSPGAPCLCPPDGLEVSNLAQVELHNENSKEIPPLDVLLVWHAYLLNTLFMEMIIPSASWAWRTASRANTISIFF